MGYAFSKLLSLVWWGPEEIKLVIVGLDNAGKTTALYKMLLNEVVVTTPTIGSNVEEFHYKNLRFIMWDIGGQEKLRSSWATYYVNTRAVILVVDSTDTERLHITKSELHKMMQNEQLSQSLLLVYANKQDLKKALSSAEISDALSLTSLDKKIQWHIQACCALTGEGLNEGLDWIVSRLKP